MYELFGERNYFDLESFLRNQVGEDGCRELCKTTTNWAVESCDCACDWHLIHRPDAELNNYVGDWRTDFADPRNGGSVYRPKPSDDYYFDSGTLQDFSAWIDDIAND